MDLIPYSVLDNVAVLLVSFYMLTKAADYLVDGAVGIASFLKIPKIIIGIVLVSFATTAPEFTVTMISAVRGIPEMALGNAVGSVIADDALALALGILVSATALKVDRHALRYTGTFLVFSMIIAFIMAFDGHMTRPEGFFLLAMVVVYLSGLIVHEKRRKKLQRDVVLPEEEEADEHIKEGKLYVQFLWFFAGVAGVILASQLLVKSAQNIAIAAGVPEVVVGLTMVAIGTSLPEIATCISACRKGHGDLAFGDIIGADILNILWIVGSASAVSGLSVGRDVILFAFPAMIIVVLTMILLARKGYQLEKWKGVVLLSLYVLYFAGTIFFFYTDSGKAFFTGILG